jgi:hypothetical protein
LEGAAVGLWERANRGEGDRREPDIDLTIAERAAATDERAEVWGRPARCPRCDGHGYLDRIDIVDRIQYEHCTNCLYRWSVREEETVSTG